MIRRAITTGVLGGLLVVVGVLYPTLAVFVPTLVPGWQSPIQHPVAHAVLLMVSAVVGLGAFLITPLAAVVRARKRGFVVGMQLGGTASLIMGAIICFAIALPLNNLSALHFLWPYFNPLTLQIGEAYLIAFSLETFNGGLVVVGGALSLTLLLGALLGGIFNSGRPRHAAMPPATLYQLSLENASHRWFDWHDNATAVGLVTGLIVGTLFAVAELQILYTPNVLDKVWPELRPLLLSALGGLLFLRSTPFPLVAILLGSLLGAFVVTLVRNPTGRYWQRVWAVITASNVAIFLWYLQLTRTIAFYTGLSPFLLARVSLTPPDPAWPLISAGLAANFATPAWQILMAFINPWLTIIVLSFASTLVAAALGMLYAAIIPIIVPRPVDYAARVRFRLRRDPDQILPMVYQLFDRNRHAYEVLAHLCVGLERQYPDHTRLVAAFHTLGTGATNQGAAPHGAAVDRAQLTGDIAELIESHPEWRYANEIGSAYRSLHQVLLADTLESLVQISPPAESTTTSVPPLIVRASGRIKDIINELHKVNRVDDLAARQTFLNKTLEAINIGQRFVDTEMRDPKQVATPYPEQAALAYILERWDELVISATKRLQGRADVVAELKSKRVSPSTRLPVEFVLRNRGLNVAERIRVRLIQSEDYFVLPPGEVSLDILPAGEKHELTLMIEPRQSAKRVRLEWSVTFDDSIESARVHQFADVAEFTTTDKPFQRIFPIPYVTGTPLKDGDVFVGRQDIFDFVKESLIGATQNNVVILHGQRRTGKTSVLYRLGDVLKETHVAVLVDMQGKPARGEVDFLFSIADDVVYALEQQGIEAPLPDRKDFEEAPEFYFRSRFIRSLYPMLGKRNLLLMFDEFEELQSRVVEGKLKSEIFQFLRNLMQHEEKTDFIFSGTHKLEELGSEYWSVLFNTAIYKRVTFLSSTEVRRLMIEPIAKYNLEYDPMAVDAVIRLAAGHPYFTQILLHEVIAYHNETQRAYITAADIEQSMERVMERGEAHFKYIWTESTPTEQKVMRLLAEALVGRNDINVMDLQAFCDTCGLPLESEDIDALHSLAGRDIVARRGKLYSFSVPLIEKWVHRTHPVMA